MYCIISPHWVNDGSTYFLARVWTCLTGSERSNTLLQTVDETHGHIHTHTQTHTGHTYIIVGWRVTEKVLPNQSTQLVTRAMKTRCVSKIHQSFVRLHVLKIFKNTQNYFSRNIHIPRKVCNIGPRMPYLGIRNTTIFGYSVSKVNDQVTTLFSAEICHFTIWNIRIQTKKITQLLSARWKLSGEGLRDIISTSIRLPSEIWTNSTN